jgi:hypothetical protein
MVPFPRKKKERPAANPVNRFGRLEPLLQDGIHALLV